jgi:CHAD domain-containing protein
VPLRSKPPLGSLARSRRFQQALGKRLQALDRHLPAALLDDAEALHRTRVASRRLRELLPIIEGPRADSSGSARRASGGVRRLTRALGGVRELDVALSLLAEVAATTHLDREAVDSIRLAIQRDRAVRYASMIRCVARLKPRKLSRRLTALGARAAEDEAAVPLGRLGQRLQARARRLEHAIDEAGALYAFDRLHRVRIAVKKLRYVLELVQEVSRLGTTRLVRRLQEAQEVLGRLHDLEVLAAYVRQAGPASADGRRSGPALVAASGEGRGGVAGDLLARIELETRRLHARYLQGAEGLRAVANACRQEMPARLNASCARPRRRPAA